MKILATPRLMRLATGIPQASGTGLPSTIITQLYKSLIDIVIQSVESTTRDVREVLRLTRMLWPIYVEPLSKYDQIELTYEDSIDGSVDSKNVFLTRNTLEKLGQALRPHTRLMLQRCLLRPGRTITIPPATADRNEVASSTDELPYLAKFLLLAAYLCQTNKADQDQNLYTNARSGRRRKTRGDNSHSESLTHASSQKALQQLRSDRIVSFPLERMLSVFSSICNKYANDETKKKSQNDLLYDATNEPINVIQLGSLSLMKCISELRQHGLVHEASASGGFYTADTSKAYSKSITSTKFACNLSRERAQRIAKGLGFPLNDYLTENK